MKQRQAGFALEPAIILNGGQRLGVAAHSKTSMRGGRKVFFFFSLTELEVAKKNAELTYWSLVLFFFPGLKCA